MPSNNYVELVMTAPEPFGSSLAYHTRSRTTLGVLIQLLVESRSHLIISAPFMQAGYGLSAGPLDIALQSALRRGVNVNIVSTGKGLNTIDHNRLTNEYPGTLQMYRPNRNIEDERKLGSHAKF